MLINPLCDMPWDIYLDYLADQGFDDLRHVPCEVLNTNGIYSPYERTTDGLGSNQFKISVPFHDCDDVTHTHDIGCCFGSNCENENQAPDLLINEIAGMRNKSGNGWISRWT